MNAFQFGQMVKQALAKSAYDPAPAYPHLPNPAVHPEYAPSTPPERFRGQQVEADIPPRIFPRPPAGSPITNDRDVIDAFPDVDTMRGLSYRGAIGQGATDQQAHDRYRRFTAALNARQQAATLPQTANSNAPEILRTGKSPADIYNPDPQIKSLWHGVERDAATGGKPDPTKRYPTPTPIRGTGRMGSIPSLNLNEVNSTYGGPNGGPMRK